MRYFFGEYISIVVVEWSKALAEHSNLVKGWCFKLSWIYIYIFILCSSLLDEAYRNLMKHDIYPGL